MSRFLTICFLLCITCSVLQAQTLRGLPENAEIKKHIEKQQPGIKSARSAHSLMLPFFEDFSSSLVFPDPMKWVNRYAFVNHSFGRNPISAGVVTLDAIDDKGEVYSRTNSPVSSDTLTSVPFDLSTYQDGADVIRLSFFYQSGGNGETPEAGDSLLLELYYPPQDKWVRTWFANGSESSAFTQEITLVPDSFYTDGFQFRFRNYTSISVNDVSGGEGALSNADCWNIDYIMMNTESAFSHEVINDITLTDIPRNLLDLYETIPWRHMKNAQPVIGRNAMNYYIRLMMQPGGLMNVGHSYYVKNLDTGKREHYDEIFSQYPTDTLIFEQDPFFAPFFTEDTTSEGNIEVVSYIVTTSTQNLQNDTSKIVLHFKDAYVYDDGTPEYGFGIEGPSMSGALLALRFRFYEPDTLQAVDLLFNKARDHFNEDLRFQLCVWKDGGGKPGDLIFMSDEYSPDLNTGLNEFKRYPLNAEENIYVTDSVLYIGWKQLTDEFLNVGYDVNSNILSRTYINVAGDWINPGGSLIPGTIMMRAVVGGKDVLTSAPEITDHSADVMVYPNPASEIIHLNTGNMKITGILLYDISGRLVLHLSGHHEQINISSLSPGFYQLILNTENGMFLNRKIVISH